MLAPEKYGTLDHRGMRLGWDIVLDGEKIRPYYLGILINLRGDGPVSQATNTSSESLKLNLSNEAID